MAFVYRFMEINIAIIGHGFVGKAIDYAFSTNKIKKHIIDPVYKTTIEQLEKIDIAFVSVPTPFGPNGEIDASIVKDVVEKLKKFNCIIVIKSTITPDIIDDLYLKNEKIVYNPEFLTEQNAIDDFINSPMNILGGKKEYSDVVVDFYKNYSKCKPCPVFYMTPKEASFVKYTINSFLATKVLWFNQLKDIIEDNCSNYNNIVDAIVCDPRIGKSHTQVPGPDGRRGFGGACFPKDISAFANFAKGKFNILNEVIKLNNSYRKNYDLNEREKDQKVNYKK